MKRFSLLELMTALAIVAVLSAIALPQVYQHQLMSKRAEVEPVLAGIRTAVFAYESAWDAWPQGLLDNPRVAGLSKAKRPWVDDADWSAVGFRPDGDLYGSYAQLYDPVGDDWHVQAFTDIDGDEWRYGFWWNREGYKTTRCTGGGPIATAPELCF